MRLLVACDHLALTGGLLRFERVGRVLARRGHTFSFLTFGTGEDGFETRHRVLHPEEAARESWDAVMVPGGGFPDATIEGFADLRAPNFGARIQHFLNAPARRDAYARVTRTFAPDLVVANNAHWDDAALDALGLPWRRLVGAVDAGLFAPPVSRPARGARHRLGGIANKRPAAQLAALDRLGDAWALHWFGRPDWGLVGARADLVASGRLVVHGPLVEADLPAWYHGLDAFCSAEAHAGWCNPAAEAMACGTPLVTTVHGTLAFAEDAVTALVVPDGPDAALGAAVALAADRIVTDPAAAASRAEAGRARIRALDWDTYADGLLAAVAEAIALRADRATAARPSGTPPRETVLRLADLARRDGALPEDFDALGYIRLHPDLAALFEHAWQGQLHYLEHGRREGRIYPSNLTRAQQKAAQASRIALAVDGLDGSGKSSIARRVAEALGATVLNPFSGQVGAILVHLARTGQHALADDVAHAAVAAAIANAPPGPVVFDRHWFTASQLLSPAYRPGWEPRPFTVMCWADRPTTIARMVARGVPNPSEHMTEDRIAGYRTLAEELRLPLLDTSRIAPEEGAAQVLAMLGANGDAAQRA
ncbi:glycosyltransferase [Methylobacterium radiotolerans]|jgi:Glycosyl transferases group 1|uniref:glycosyltransferase n=1 Tax=Methylobacterium TaxID=407 RepID=UPI0005DC38BC|nr:MULTISPECIES: glycosyltransferase [Methylobacterium]GAN46376.1 putative glycosyl transferase [Methylobacterium sp. ME121]KTS10587.1 group 1 glycosyl transferase [Methylobacterium radiotolerans]KTS49937.1 group 1 glycosyl transferase [Methylobacterium radiotolerans]MBN6818139.1 glycosyltransferase [Methylobacterium organophilum]ONF48707.1 group 1 glycosyl transferase [Methylobacterium radiotolerans]